MRCLLIVLSLNSSIVLVNAQTDSLKLQLIEFLKVTNDMHILEHNGHGFLLKADSTSCAKRTAIPAENGQGFLRKADSRRW